MVATQAQVYEAIDSERAYQDARWNASTTPTAGKQTASAFILFMEHYLSEARRRASTTAEGNTEVLDFIRKVTALGVICMEQHGAPLRVPESLFTPEMQIMGMPTMSGTLYPSRRRIADADRRQGSAQRRGAQRRMGTIRRAPALVSARRAGDKPYPDRRHLTDRRAHINTGRRSLFTPARRKS